MNALEQQTLFEIVMAVGNGVELHAMLQNSLSVMMRKLGCNMGAVARCVGDDISLVHGIPHHIKNSSEILSMCRRAQTEPTSPNQPRIIGGEAQVTMVFVLPDFGFLVLGKTGETLSKAMCGTLCLIANKLALACIACQQAHAVRDAQQRTQLLLDSAAEGIYGVDIHGLCTFANASFLKTFAYQNITEIIGKPIHELIHSRPADDVDAKVAITETPLFSSARYEKKIHASDEVFWRRDGTSFPVEYWSYPVELNGVTSGSVVTFFDITERKANEDQVKNLAFYDPLTALPNRRLVMDRLQHALVSSARRGREGALLFLDLDNFKTLNDTLGHAKGDLLLQQVAARLSGCVRESDTVARIGGDEFVVMLEGLSGEEIEAAAQVKFIGEKIFVALNQPYDLTGHEYHNTASIGIALFNDCQSSVDELMKRADLAMYQAKSAGRNTLRFFDPQMQIVITARTLLEKDLRESLQHKHFLLCYQPQVDGAGNITGCEALVRWQHPQRGMISPAEFIPVAESTGLILPLGAWVLETACAQLVTWATMPPMAHLTMAVNVSARQLRQPNFVAQVLDVIDRSGANPQLLKLELTESMLVDDVEEIIAKMTELKLRGVGFSLDDFGTGYSSLSYLKRLPLDQLKIDQSFVRDLLVDPHDAAIAQTIIALAQSLGMAVIAEGVETIAQRDVLAAQGCHAFQGYLFSRPVPAEGFERLFMPSDNTQQT